MTAYKCPAGIWTIGYGHTDGVYKGQKISQNTAEEYLKSDLLKYEKGVENAVKVSLNQNQFDALVSFSYNCGIAALKYSTLLKKLNAGDYDVAAKEFSRWNKSNGRVLLGLARRRNAEKKLFKTPAETFHVIQKGETLSGIAKKYGTNYTKLAKINGIKNPNIIYPGQKLKIK